MNTSEKSNRIAVIGAGISGLSLGWLFGQDKRYDVTLFEGFSSNGLDAYAYVVPAKHEVFENDEPLHIDVPFRYHVPNIYYNLTRLCRLLGVQTHKFEQDISLYDQNGDFILGYSTGHFLGFSYPKFFWRNFISRKFYQYAWNFYWFRRSSWDHYRQGELHNLTLGQYLEKMNYSKEFVEDFLLNYLSLVMTCEFEVLKNYPAELLIRFLYDMTAGCGLWQFKYGTKDFAARLCKNVNIQCNTYVANVSPITLKDNTKKVKITFHDGKEEIFDHVIFSTQPNVSAKLINANSVLSEQREALEKFPVVESSMTIHTDLSVIPQNTLLSKNTLHNKVDGAIAHKILNLTLPQLSDIKKTVVMSFSLKEMEVDKENLLHSVTMKRQVHNAESMNAMHRLHELQGQHNVWYCGGFMLPAVALLESGVASACDIVSNFDISIPWEFRPITGRKGYVERNTFSTSASFYLWGFVFLLFSFLFCASFILLK